MHNKMEKIIDESVQGTAIALAKKENSTRKLYIESYGCAMNFSDSEIVASILSNEGFSTTQELEDADLVLVNTCSIREKAELTIRKTAQATYEGGGSWMHGRKAKNQIVGRGENCGHGSRSGRLQGPAQPYPRGG